MSDEKTQPARSKSSPVISDSVTEALRPSTPVVEEPVDIASPRVVSSVAASVSGSSSSAQASQLTNIPTESQPSSSDDKAEDKSKGKGKGKRKAKPARKADSESDGDSVFFSSDSEGEQSETRAARIHRDVVDHQQLTSTSRERIQTVARETIQLLCEQQLLLIEVLSDFPFRDLSSSADYLWFREIFNYHREGDDGYNYYLKSDKPIEFISVAASSSSSQRAEASVKMPRVTRESLSDALLALKEAILVNAKGNLYNQLGELFFKKDIEETFEHVLKSRYNDRIRQFMRYDNGDEPFLHFKHFDALRLFKNTLQQLLFLENRADFIDELLPTPEVASVSMRHQPALRIDGTKSAITASKESPVFSTTALEGRQRASITAPYKSDELSERYQRAELYGDEKGALVLTSKAASSSSSSSSAVFNQDDCVTHTAKETIALLCRWQPWSELMIHPWVHGVMFSADSLETDHYFLNEPRDDDVDHFSFLGISEEEFFSDMLRIEHNNSVSPERKAAVRKQMRGTILNALFPEEKALFKLKDGSEVAKEWSKIFFSYTLVDDAYKHVLSSHDLTISMPIEQQLSALKAQPKVQEQLQKLYRAKGKFYDLLLTLCEHEAICQQYFDAMRTCPDRVLTRDVMIAHAIATQYNLTIWSHQPGPGEQLQRVDETRTESAGRSLHLFFQNNEYSRLTLVKQFTEDVWVADDVREPLVVMLERYCDGIMALNHRIIDGAKAQLKQQLEESGIVPTEHLDTFNHLIKQYFNVPLRRFMRENKQGEMRLALNSRREFLMFKHFLESLRHELLRFSFDVWNLPEMDTKMEHGLAVLYRSFLRVESRTRPNQSQVHTLISTTLSSFCQNILLARIEYPAAQFAVDEILTLLSEQSGLTPMHLILRHDVLKGNVCRYYLMKHPNKAIQQLRTARQISAGVSQTPLDYAASIIEDEVSSVQSKAFKKVFEMLLRSYRNPTMNNEQLDSLCSIIETYFSKFGWNFLHLHRIYGSEVNELWDWYVKQKLLLQKVDWLELIDQTETPMASATPSTPLAYALEAAQQEQKQLREKGASDQATEGEKACLNLDFNLGQWDRAHLPGKLRQLRVVEQSLNSDKAKLPFVWVPDQLRHVLLPGLEFDKAMDDSKRVLGEIGGLLNKRLPTGKSEGAKKLQQDLDERLSDCFIADVIRTEQIKLTKAMAELNSIACTRVTQLREGVDMASSSSTANAASADTALAQWEQLVFICSSYTSHLEALTPFDRLESEIFYDMARRNYSNVFAVHDKARASCLSRNEEYVAAKKALDAVLLKHWKKTSTWARWGARVKAMLLGLKQLSELLKTFPESIIIEEAALCKQVLESANQLFQAVLDYNNRDVENKESGLFAQFCKEKAFPVRWVSATASTLTSFEHSDGQYFYLSPESQQYFEHYVMPETALTQGPHEYPEASHPVIKYGARGLHFKFENLPGSARVESLPLLPGKEYMAFSLFVDGNTAPSTLVKFDYHGAKGPGIIRMVQAMRSVEGITVKKLIRHLGPNAKIFQHIPPIDFRQSLCRNNLADMMVQGMLFNNHDFKDDNALVQVRYKKDEGETALCEQWQRFNGKEFVSRLSLIDGELVYLEEFDEQEDGRVLVNVRNFLYCDETLMQTQVPLAYRHYFLSKSVQTWVMEWLGRLLNQNHQYQSLISGNIMGEEAMGRLELPYHFTPGLIYYIESKFEKIHHLFKDVGDGPLTFDSLLKAVMSITGDYCAAIRRHYGLLYPEDPNLALQSGIAAVYSQKDGSREEGISPADLFAVMVDNNPDFSTYEQREKARGQLEQRLRLQAAEQKAYRKAGQCLATSRASTYPLTHLVETYLSTRDLSDLSKRECQLYLASLSDYKGIKHLVLRRLPIDFYTFTKWFWSASEQPRTKKRVHFMNEVKQITFYQCPHIRAKDIELFEKQWTLIRLAPFLYKKFCERFGPRWRYDAFVKLFWGAPGKENVNSLWHAIQSDAQFSFMGCESLEKEVLEAFKKALFSTLEGDNARVRRVDSEQTLREEHNAFEISQQSQKRRVFMTPERAMRSIIRAGERTRYLDFARFLLKTPETKDTPSSLDKSQHLAHNRVLEASLSMVVDMKHALEQYRDHSLFSTQFRTQNFPVIYNEFSLPGTRSQYFIRHYALQPESIKIEALNLSRSELVTTLGYRAEENVQLIRRAYNKDMLEALKWDVCNMLLNSAAFRIHLSKKVSDALDAAKALDEYRALTVGVRD